MRASLARIRRLPRIHMSDIAAGIVRMAVVLTFSVWSYFGPPGQPMLFTWIAIWLAAAFTLVFFALASLSGRPPLYLRPFLLLVDIIMITGIVATYGFSATAVSDLYYIVVITAAMWHGAAAAVLVSFACLAAFIGGFSLGIGSFPSPMLLWSAVWDSGALFLIPFSFVVGFLLAAYREDQRLLHETMLEASLARQLQEDMMPRRPLEVPGWRVCARMVPAAGVGGDIYDFLKLGDRGLIVVADAAGKSFYGMVHLSMIRSHLRAAAPGCGGPASVATELNKRAWDALQPYSYVALVIVEVQMGNSVARYVNCGHYPPLLVRAAGGDPQALATGDPIIGARKGHEYHEGQVELQPGDAIVVYTDGLVEARNRRGELFGEARVRQVLAEMRGRGPEEICQRLLEAASQWASGHLVDDCTVVVIAKQ